MTVAPFAAFGRDELDVRLRAASGTACTTTGASATTSSRAHLFRGVLMEFTNEFMIPVDVDEAFAVLTDLERVAPCMPGATLEEVDGATYSGRMKVKVGPMSLTYAGTATLTDQDLEARTARIEASGREKRGGGTASAGVHASMEEVDGGTRVLVSTEISVTGKPAQFGRGVMADVGAQIIDRFADNLREELLTDRSGGGPTDEASLHELADDAEADASPGPRRVEHRLPKDEALDLMDVAGGATARRLVLVLVAVIPVLLTVAWHRRRG